jgi:DNA polymerase-3 subunit delta'
MDKKSDRQFSWPLIGNEAVVDFLTKSLRRGKIAQTYIFSGPDDLGKSQTAYCLAKNLMLLDSNSQGELENLDLDKMALSGDLHVIAREEGKKNISIDQVRDFNKILEMGSFSGSYKIGIIKAAETLSLEAANALLKLLEEPQAKVVIILLTAQINYLLPTIVSRAQVINFYAVKTEVLYNYLMSEYGATPVTAKDLSSLALGRPALAVKFWENKEFLEDYLNRARLFLSFFDNNLMVNLKAGGSLANAGDDGRGATGAVAWTLDIWEGLARDFILLQTNNPDLIRHQILRADLKNLENDAVDWRRVLGNLQRARSYLAANVAPKNVLENVIINLA